MQMKRFIKEYYKELMEILNCIKVGIYIADEESNTILLNDESEKTGGLKREQLIGTSMTELIKQGYVEDSTILKAIASNKEASIVQNLGDGGHLYITGVPLIKNDKLELVVCTERDITETMNLKDLLKETEEMAQKYETELAQLRNQKIQIYGELVAESLKMRTVIEKTIRIAKLDTTVLFTGESGTGKEMLANLLHGNSARKNAPFIKINCAAIPENLLESELFGYEKGSFSGADRSGKVGLFELADGGTLFLDEIGDLPFQMQSKLLRALQEKEIMRIGATKATSVDVRIIAATNMDLENAIESGRFREDLYYRLNVLPINIPPLRERKEDIGKLAVYFIEQFNREYQMNKAITEEGISALENYNWPGNIRQLRNIIERIMVSFDGHYISSFQVEKQLPAKIDQEEKESIYKAWEDDLSLDELIGNYEKDLLISALESLGNATEVAKKLKVNKSTISRKLRKYGIITEN